MTQVVHRHVVQIEVFLSLSREKPPSHRINILVCAEFFLVLVFRNSNWIPAMFFNHSNRKDNRRFTCLIRKLKKNMALCCSQSHAVKAEEFNEKKSYDIFWVFCLCKWSRQLFANILHIVFFALVQIFAAIILIFLVSSSNFNCCKVPRSY